MSENPMIMIYWRIASAATHLAQAFDTTIEGSVNECDPDPLVDTLVAAMAEDILMRERA